MLIVFILTVSVLNPLEAQHLNRDQLLELRTKLSEYKKTKDYDARKPIVDAILDMGPKGASELSKTVEKDFLSVQKKYITDLGKKAGVVQKKRYEKSHKKEIKEARAVFASLRAKGDALGKAEIVSKGDPALEKLKTIIISFCEGCSR